MYCNRGVHLDFDDNYIARYIIKANTQIIIMLDANETSFTK